ncbi:MAG: ORF6N domain-containing protein, partial [Parcubacteria group bacterium]
LNQSVTRNIRRFPVDFMFALNDLESDQLRLRSQFVISKNGSKRGGRRYKTRVFTEQGVAMLSSVLKSERAVLVNIAIIRTFVKLRHLLATHKDLARKLEELEKRYDASFRMVFKAIKALTQGRENPKRGSIGFVTDKK